MDKKRQKPFARALFLLGILIGIAIGVLVSKRLFEPVKQTTQSEATEEIEETQTPKKTKTTWRKPSKSVEEIEFDKLAASIDSLMTDTTFGNIESDSSDNYWSWEDTIDISDAGLPYDSAIDVSGGDGIVLAKDVLIAVKYILPDGDKNNFNCDSNDDLDSLLVDYQNPKLDDELRVEFWKSPINYKGYILTRNKLALYGVYQFNAVKLEYHSDGQIRMLYLNESYIIRCSDKFVPFN